MNTFTENDLYELHMMSIFRIQEIDRQIRSLAGIMSPDDMKRWHDEKDRVTKLKDKIVSMFA